MKKIKIKCTETLYPKLLDLLKHVKWLGQMGCSRKLILLDGDIKTDKKNSEWYIDGDGSDKIRAIKE